MGLIPSLRSSLRDPNKWLSDFFARGVRTESGADISEQSSLAISAVFSCVTLISETKALLPMIVYRRRKSGGKDRATDHPLYSVLHDAPNEETTAFNYAEAQSSHRLLWGFSASVIERFEVGGGIKSLWMLQPDTTTIKRNDKTGKLFFETNENGKITQYPYEKVLHIPSFSKNGINGKSVIGFQREKLGIASALDRFEARFFGSGTNPGAIITMPIEARGMNDETARAYLNALNDQYGGISNAGGLMLLRNGEQFQRAVMPLVDAQFIDLYKAKAIDVCGWFKVPPHMIALLDRATYSNIEQQSIQFVQYCILPHLRREEQAINKCLLSDIDKRRGYFVESLADMLLRGDVQTRSEFYKSLFNIGAMSQNDIREKENLNPIEGGDQYFVPLNMIPADQAGKPQDQTPTRSLEGQSIEYRDRIESSINIIGNDKKTARKLVLSFADKVVKREVEGITEGLKILDQRSAESDFNVFLDEFYRTHADFTAREFAPIVDLIMRGSVRSSGQILGQDIEITEALLKFFADYVQKFTYRYTQGGMNQIKKLNDKILTQEAIDSGLSTRELIVGRLSEWMDTRVDKIATDESVRMVSAASREAWRSSGVKKMRWHTKGKNCPHCNHLAGKIVSIDAPFLRDGDVIYAGPDGKSFIYNPNDPESVVPKGKGTEDGWSAMKSYGSKHHPPIHQGCDCYVLPEV